MADRAGRSKGETGGSKAVKVRESLRSRPASNADLPGAMASWRFWVLFPTAHFELTTRRRAALVATDRDAWCRWRRADTGRAPGRSPRSFPRGGLATRATRRRA